MKIYLNDQLVDASEAKVSVFDHGLLYGDGIFEGKLLSFKYLRVIGRCRELLGRFPTYGIMLTPAEGRGAELWPNLGEV